MKTLLKTIFSAFAGIAAAVLLIVNAPIPEPTIPENPPIESSEGIEPNFYEEDTEYY